MKITDEMVEAAARAIRPDLWGPSGTSLVSHDFVRDVVRRVAREALVAAFATLPQGFCVETLGCRLANHHKGGCERS
jgi:hypothetical protein